MAKPAPYPPTDAAEVNAVNTFIGLLDAKRVKTDIRTRDKYPNIDGIIELVDHEQHPLGKFDVQIRKIGDGQNSYSCPASLVGYSEVSTLQIILICVDVSSRHVYWRQITPTMPEYKQGQDSFIIRFNKTADCIDPDGVYIQKWNEIILDYRERIARFPELQREIENKLTLKSLSRKDKRFFQQYIDTINRLLDDDFIAIKRIMFPDVWKLGVGIFDAGEEWVSFQIFKIPYEEPAPLVCKLEGNPFQATTLSLYAISAENTRRENLGDPDFAAKSFVLDSVKRVVEERMLPVHGKLTSIDVLFAFIDRYSSILAISPDDNAFDVEELNYAINRYMLGVCASIASKIVDPSNRIVSLNLDSIRNYIRENKVEPIPPSSTPIIFSVSSRSFPISAVFDALRNLLSEDILVIKRPFARRSRKLVPGDNWIWSGYTPDDEIKNITLMLENALPEYSEFVSRNRFRLPDSIYLNPSTAIIMEYEPVAASNLWMGPRLHEYHINNPSQTLPKISTSVIEGGKGSFGASNFPQVTYGGVVYRTTSSSNESAGFLFSNIPMLTLLYKMLEHDLSKNYEIGSFSTRY